MKIHEIAKEITIAAIQNTNALGNLRDSHSKILSPTEYAGKIAEFYNAFVSQVNIEKSNET